MQIIESRELRSSGVIWAFSLVMSCFTVSSLLLLTLWARSSEYVLVPTVMVQILMDAVHVEMVCRVATI